MTVPFVPFDAVWARVVEAVDSVAALPERAGPVYLVRDLRGQIRISLSEDVEDDAACHQALDSLAGALHDKLGPHRAPKEGRVLFVDPALLHSASETARRVHRDVYLVDRLVTGSDWWTVRDSGVPPGVQRFTLFSVKGGVGRSTTAAVLARHLADNGQRVLVVDLDLESPGLSAMLDASARPQFGATDWFVEDLVGQGEHVLPEITAAPRWAQDLEGEVRVVPAHGRDPGEYLAKLGRVYMDVKEAWTARLHRLLARLEDRHKPTIVLVESRSGLHDIAAATVTDLDAQVLIFATDSHSMWTDYEILFRHWQRHNLASRIRERLFIVSALTPETEIPLYLRGFRERSWDLFRNVYDEVQPDLDSASMYSFDLDDNEAPHYPVPIYWNRGLAAGASLRNLRDTQPVALAYAAFLKHFASLIAIDNGGKAS